MSSYKKIGVLVFPAGEINSIELHEALSTCVNIRLFGASSVERHGGFIYKNYISGAPHITAPNFIEAFNLIIENNRIDLIIPTHDDVAVFLAEKQNDIKAKILMTDKKTTQICRDKLRTYETFASFEFCPRYYSDLKQLPVYVKPRKGQGSVNTRLITCEADSFNDIDLSEYVICEYLPGEELTVDCFTDKDGCLQAVLPRSRKRVFGGVSVRSENMPLTSEITNIAEMLNKRLSFLGLWYFQIKQDDKGKFKLLEISTRCAGTMCLSRALGINLPLLSVYAAMGYKTEVFANNYNITVDRTLISRYKTDFEYESVYIDLDDTIIINSAVNLQAMRFLYQCVNKDKRIILITRHCEDHNDSVIDVLKRHRIAPELFDEIIELDFSLLKYKKIEPEKAIFIDNSFAERKSVFEKLNIPVFDVDGIEVLLDWRK
ncbi:MAG: ATP-grasp domain-containing protein [Oscillospiraceae bacterium]|jgi:predicted ATP-grasp superfamily ATP-dependent carboligase|nr:ATP-grasp domain-containing protein [Oscillospiraceae bacterium]